MEDIENNAYVSSFVWKERSPIKYLLVGVGERSYKSLHDCVYDIISIVMMDG